MAYALTEDGASLPVCCACSRRGALGSRLVRRRGGPTEGLRHVACGSLLEARWYCPTCSMSVGDDEGSALRYA